MSAVLTSQRGCTARGQARLTAAAMALAAAVDVVAGHVLLAQEPPVLLGSATLAAYRMDIDGNGAIDPATEEFSLTVVAGGDDGTVQFFRAAVGSETRTLFSVVRLPGPATSVTIHASERVAYIGAGARGVAVVDLEGPASIQPIDLDRNGEDDRILGFADTPGTASRMDLAAARGFGVVADGDGGAATLELAAPRVSFSDVLRDPLLATTSDESSILSSRLAFSSDDAIRIRLSALLPPGHTASLAIDEAKAPGAEPAVAFDGGSLAVPVPNGASEVVARLRPGVARADVTLRALGEGGATLAAFAFAIEPFTAGVTTAAAKLVVRPGELRLSTLAPRGLIAAGLELGDGRFVNVTSSPETTFEAGNPVVASVDTRGEVRALAGGHTQVLVTHGGRTVAVPVTVSAPAAIQEYAGDSPLQTVTRVGVPVALRAPVRLTDGRVVDVTSLPGATFASSNPAVATVDARGLVTAVGPGRAAITATAGGRSQEVVVDVEPWTTPDLSSLAIEPIGDAVTTDAAAVDVVARVEGTGSVQGLDVAFTLDGRTSTGKTGYDGRASVRFGGLSLPGARTVTASVVDPTGGDTLSASAGFQVTARGTDTEPNDGLAAAVPVVVGPVRRAIAGQVGGGDAADTFRVMTTAPGTITARVSFAGVADLSAIRVVVRSAAGAELQRVTPASPDVVVSASVPAGGAVVEVTSSGPVVGYRIEPRFDQSPISIAGVSPLSAAVGARVTISGGGFDTAPGATRVYVGGVGAQVDAVTPTTIEAVVPVLAVNGRVEVVSGTQRAEGPAIDVGRPGAPMVGTLPADPAFTRRDPLTGHVLNVSRVLVSARPGVTPAEMAALAASLGGTVAGTNAVIGSYVLEFRGHATIEQLERTRRALEGDARVRFTGRHTLERPLGVVIDAKALTVAFPAAFDAARVYEAVRRVRRTPPFDDGAKLRRTNVAVIDTGFRPIQRGDYQSASAFHVEFFRQDNAGMFVPQSPLIDDLTTNHGTAVTSVIAAMNDGASPLSGVLGGAFATSESPLFRVQVFAALSDPPGLIDGPSALDALSLLATRTGDDVIDAVNLSFGSAHTSNAIARLADSFYRDAVAALSGKTVVVIAAGNDGIQASAFSPAQLSLEFAHVITVGASAAVNGDGTGEVGDFRAVFGGTLGEEFDGVACVSGLLITGSNCGEAVTLAAPGEDVAVASSVKRYQFKDRDGVLHEKFVKDVAGPLGFKTSRGTSFAAPMVAGLIGLLQAVRPAGPRLDPLTIKNLLLDTAEDVSPTWDAGPMRRIDAFRGVTALLPPPAARQPIFVADEEADTAAGVPGAIVSLNVDPRTGLLDDSAPATLGLGFSVGGQDVLAQRPTSLAVSPVGDEAYVVARLDSPALGDGIAVLDTLGETFTGFIPFSGAPLVEPPGGGAGAIAPVTVPDARTALAVTPDGRLLYAAMGARLLVIDLASRRLVTRLSELPAPYGVQAAAFPPAALSQRLADITAAVTADRGTRISALAMSPDGRRLYAAVQAGNGPGLQPGRLLAIETDLYLDNDPATHGLQSDLGTYLSVIGSSTMPGTGTAAAGDEPTAVLVDPLHRFAYLVTGGLDGYTVISPFASGSGPSLEPGVAERMFGNVTFDELQTLANEGFTFVRARGFTGVFNVTGGAAPTFTHAFPSDVNFGWNTSAATTTQFRFGDVLAKRPFGAALRPLDQGGVRVLLPLFQTGNFAVLDTEVDDGFLSPPAGGTPRPEFTGLPKIPLGVVAVTPALRLDQNMWPKRGRLVVGDTIDVPSPDEALLFPGPIHYAQNGRFAVASHLGTGRPRDLTVTLPESPTPALTRALGELSLPFSAGATLTLRRGGGAISIIDDGDLRQGLGTAGQSVNLDGGAYPVLAINPVCATSVAGGLCGTSAVRSVLTYRSPGGREASFARPRGVAIQPFVGIEAPRFGDHVSDTSGITIEWRDAAVDQVEVVVRDLLTFQTVAATPAAAAALTPAERNARTRTVTFASLFTVVPPRPSRRYRITAAIKDSSFQEQGTSGVLSSTSVEVVYEPIVAASGLRLSPRLILLRDTGATGSLRAHLDRADGTTVDVTGQTAFEWIGSGMAEADVPGFAAALADVNRLLGTTQAPAPVGVARIIVDASGQVTATAPGFQAVRARHPDVPLGSDLAFVLVGFSLDRIRISGQQLLASTTPALIDQLLLNENTALVLGRQAGAFVSSKGLAVLSRVDLRYASAGTLSVCAVVEALEAMAPSPNPPFMTGECVDRLLALAGQPGGALAFSVRDAAVASVCPDESGPYQSCVASVASGITTIGGTLDLSAIGVGSATDDVFTLVVDRLDGAEIVPGSVVIDKRQPPAAGPLAQTMACLPPVSDSLPKPAEYVTTEAFRDAWLPDGWDTGTGTVTLGGLDDGFALSVRGTVTALVASVDVDLARVCFAIGTAPTPGVSATYRQSATLVSVVPAGAFASRFEHLGQAGATLVSSTVSIEGLGEATGTASVLVCECPASAPTGDGLAVTEAVLQPVQDWNDSAGGNGVPFDGQPGTGTVDNEDVWVEVASLSALATWTLRLTDANGATFDKVIGPPDLFSPVKVVTGFGLGASRVVKLELIDNVGFVRVALDAAAIEQVLGPATNADDEALSYSVFGSPTPPTQGFLRRRATIGRWDIF